MTGIGLLARYGLTKAPSTDPDDVPNLALWLDANDASTLTLDGSGNVSEWRDKSGAARHAAQATSTARPAFGGLGFGGKPALAFDGVDDILTIGNLSGLIHDKTGATVIMVARTPTTSTVKRAFSLVSRPQTLIYRSIFAIWADQGIISANARKHSSEAGSTTVAGPAEGAAHVLTACMDYGSLAALNFYANGVHQGEDAIAGAGTRSNAALVAAAIGAFYATGSPSQYWEGDIAEIILYHRELSAEERTGIEAYLANKWGIPL